MKVTDFKKKVRRTTEAAFEKLLAEVLAERGLYSRHMSDRFSGVPDRYIAGGRWVELKSLEYARGIVPYGAGLSAEQKRVCSDLIAGGDEVWYLALIASGRGQNVILMPMRTALKRPERSVDVGMDENVMESNVYLRGYYGKETLADLLRYWS